MISGTASLEGVLADSDQLPVKEKKITYENVGYRVIRLHPSQLELVWKGDDGKPMRGYDVVQTHYGKKNRKCLFLMNAGIFEPGGIPSGLHIQDGKLLLPLNHKAGKGNFYLKPNGVFWWSRHSKSTMCGVASTDKFSKNTWLQLKKHLDGKEGRKMSLNAVQSGPLLLQAGRIHPAFNKDSSSTLYRNGVGVDSDGNIVFVVTDKKQEVNLYGFARVFLHLGCKNALFLDGDLSHMELSPKKPIRSHLFGAVFVVSEKKQ